MKNIILACGSGVATSTVVANKVKDLLDSNGFSGQYNITQCSIAEAVGKSENADLLIATTVAPDGIKCPYISGVPFLIGVGKEAVEQQVLDFMKK
ncbi:MAG: PTS sugar transporter subunit IIB [Atopobiaceae bacterium]|jgi:PTS system galactitol-specific IIB component|nr:PTS sugar transporter subunit IIB [Atopobiaceae bacterium]MCI2173871.1 PTS sugar transporter subunit IIB [Atopobiaceae bacterium]MCI2208039.1 PTS sugar transporter subunit IIB [Atopobiaceae bacterium]